MAITVLDYWGIRSSEDVGNMVFNLVGAGVFGKTDDDTIESFREGYDFAEAFVLPFRPEPKKLSTIGSALSERKHETLSRPFSPRISDDDCSCSRRGSRPDEPTLPESRARVFSFENGLTLIVEEDRSAPVASVQAWCATGSVNEGKWMGAGLSHILEHMLFKGTASRKAGEIARQIQDRGGYINAYTSFDRTVYWIDVPTDGVAEALTNSMGCHDEFDPS